MTEHAVPQHALPFPPPLQAEPIVPPPHLVRRGEGTPLVFVHGNGLDHRFLLPLDECFDERSAAGPWERIYVDLPGFGKTPVLGEAGGLPDIADWLDAVVGQLVGDRPFALVGNSLGGLLVREIAARRPERCLGLALLAPVVHAEHRLREVPARRVLAEDPELLASLDPADAASYADAAVVQSPANWLAFRDAALPGIRAADERAMTRLARRYALERDPQERLRGYAGNVLVVAGRSDPVVGYADQRRLADDFEHATYAVLDRAGHNVHLDQPDTVGALLRDWAAALAVG